MLFDRMQYSYSMSAFDIPMIMAAIFGLLGLIYGFLLILGPVLWGIIGSGAGFLLGLGIKLITTRNKTKKQKEHQPEVVLIIECEEKSDADGSGHALDEQRPRGLQAKSRRGCIKYCL